MRKRWIMAALLVALACVPVLAPRHVVTIGAETFIFAIAAMSLNLLLGYTGLVSLGHASIFGVGAYIAGLIAVHVSSMLWLTVPAAVAGAALLSLLLGYFALRTSGVSFLMVTLAFGQMLYGLAVKWNQVTRGSDGLAGISRPTGLGLEMTTPRMYWLLLAIMVLIYLLLRCVVESPFGRALVGIRENADRMFSLGFNVFNYQLAAFGLAGAVAGLAGALFAHFNGFVSPGELHWTASGNMMIMVVIGGAGTLVGPIWGAATLMILQHVVPSLTDHWQTVLGLLFITFTLGGRGGLLGWWYRLQSVLPGRTSKGVRP